MTEASTVGIETPQEKTMKTIVTFGEPYLVEAVVEKAAGKPPYLTSVKYVKMEFEGKLLDVTAQVVGVEHFYKRLEDRIMQVYHQRMAAA
jgi:hypothetical protein